MEIVLLVVKLVVSNVIKIIKNAKNVLLLQELIKQLFSVALVVILNVFLVQKITQIVNSVLQNFLWREVHVSDAK